MESVNQGLQHYQSSFEPLSQMVENKNSPKTLTTQKKDRNKIKSKGLEGVKEGDEKLASVPQHPALNIRREVSVVMNEAKGSNRPGSSMQSASQENIVAMSAGSGK